MSRLSPPSCVDDLLTGPCADESMGYLLAQVRSIMASEVQQLTQLEHELSSTQASLLLLLQRGQSSGADLARAYGIDASAVTRLLDKLQQRGLVTRTRSADDRRVVHLMLTSDGTAMVGKLKPLFQRVLERMLAVFSAEEVDVLRSLLRRIVVNCEAPSTK